MSHIIDKIKQHRSKLVNKSGESTSSTNAQSQTEGDSRLHRSQCITNTPIVAGTFTLLIVFAFSPFTGAPNTYATASTLSVSVSTGANPVVNVSPSAEGNFAASTATTFGVSTTHAAGYTVTASATSLTDGGANTLNTLSTGTTINADSFSDSANTRYNNLWGYKPSSYYDTANDQTIDNTTEGTSYYLPAPITTAQTLDITNAAADKSYDIAMGVRVDNSAVAGEYSSVITVAVVGNATPYSITYNKNTTDTVSNMPTNHTTTDTGASGETVTLATNTPTRTGYTFNGWCTTTPTASAGVDSCSGTKYSAGGSWTLDQTDDTNDLALYAMWNRRSYSVRVNFAGDGVSSVTFAADGYTTRTVSASGGTVSLMYGVQYTVTMSFSEGYGFDSWALNNANYGLLSPVASNPTKFTPNSSSGYAVITATGGKPYLQNFTKSDCELLAKDADYTVYDIRDNKAYTVRYINGACWMTRNLRFSGTSVNKATSDVTADQTITWYSLRGTDVSTSGKCYATASSGSGFTTFCKYDSNTGTTGIWYNYYAATAGTVSGTVTTATQSICPKNWTLPAKGSSAGQIGSVLSYVEEFSPTTGGYYGNGSIFNKDGGEWWGSTQYNTNYRDTLEFKNGSLGTYYIHKVNGAFIRCVRTS